MRVEERRRGIALKNTQPDIQYYTRVGQNLASLFINCVCLQYISSSFAVLISHNKMYADTKPPSLVLYILGYKYRESN